MNVILDERGQVLCPNCKAVMKKCYWKPTLSENYYFNGLYLCSDCGERVFDKFRHTYLSSVTTNSSPKEVN